MNPLHELLLAEHNELTRRRFLAAAVAGVAVGMLAGCITSNASASKDKDTASKDSGIKPYTGQRYKIGVCDWMMYKRQTLGAFPLAKTVGADGVEVDMGVLSSNPTFINKLNTPEARQQWHDAATQDGLEICDLAMSGMYGWSLAKRPTYMKFTQDCIDTLVAMNIKLAFLPLNGGGDVIQHPELNPPVIERLKQIAPLAEKAGVVLGIANVWSAEEYIKVLDQVNSPAIKAYYNFADAGHYNRNIVSELKTLGRDRICQIHCTDEDGLWIQEDPKLNMPAIKQTLDDMGWSGWLVVERSRSKRKSRDVKYNFTANCAYMKHIFQGAPMPESTPTPTPGKIKPAADDTKD